MKIRIIPNDHPQLTLRSSKNRGSGYGYPQIGSYGANSYAQGAGYPQQGGQYMLPAPAGYAVPLLTGPTEQRHETVITEQPTPRLEQHIPTPEAQPGRSFMETLRERYDVRGLGDFAKLLIGGVAGYVATRPKILQALYNPEAMTSLAGIGIGMYLADGIRIAKDETWEPAPESVREQWEKPEVTNRYGKFGTGKILWPVPFYNNPKRWVEVNKTYKQFLPGRMDEIFDNMMYTNALIGVLMKDYKDDPLAGLHALRQLKLARNKARWGMFYDIPSKIKNMTLDQGEKYYDEYLQCKGFTTPRMLHQMNRQMAAVEDAGHGKAEGKEAKHEGHGGNWMEKFQKFSGDLIGEHYGHAG